MMLIRNHRETNFRVITLVRLMVLNTSFINISVILWRSVLLVGKTTDLSQVIDKRYHIMLYTSSWSRFELTTSVVIDTDCICSCKCNYHTIITAMTVLLCTRNIFHQQSNIISTFYKCYVLSPVSIVTHTFFRCINLNTFSNK